MSLTLKALHDQIKIFTDMNLYPTTTTYNLNWEKIINAQFESYKQGLTNPHCVW